MAGKEKEKKVFKAVDKDGKEIGSGTFAEARKIAVKKAKESIVAYRILNPKGNEVAKVSTEVKLSD